MKLVGRGNYTDYMEKDIRNLRMALNILRESADEMEFRRKLKLQIFPEGAAGIAITGNQAAQAPECV